MIKLLPILCLLNLLFLPAISSARADITPPGQARQASPTATNDNENDLTTGAKNWKPNLEDYRQAKEEEKQERLQNMAYTLIDNRISLLEALKDRVQAMTRIEEQERIRISSDIDEAILKLEELRTQINNETQLQNTKQLVKSIFNDIRVYTLTAPKNLGESLVAHGMYILGRLQAIQRQLEQTLNQNKNAGKDTTQLEPLMTQIQNQLALAQEQLTIADEKFKSMTPANTQTVKASRDAGKEALRQAKEALKQAHRLLKQIREELKTLSGTTSPTPEESPLVSPSPTLSPEISPTLSPTLSPTPEESPTT